MSNKAIMFEKREMFGGISWKLAYKLLSEKEIHSVRIGRTYKTSKVCIRYIK